MVKQREFTGSILVILAAMSWGFSGIFVRFFSALGVSTMHLTLFKVGFAGLVLLAYCLLFDRDALKVRWQDLWVFLCSGLVSMVFFTWAYFSTIQATSMSAAATLLYAAPAIVMLLSALLFKEALTRRKVLACVLAFAGCALVSGFVGDAAPLPLRAVITGFLSALGYALYSIFGKIAIGKGYRTNTITTYTFLFAILGSLVFLRPAEIRTAALAGGSIPKFVLMAILMSVVVSLLPYMLYTNGLERVPAGKASIMASVEPVTATVVGAIAFHEIPDVYGFLGIALVLFAIALLNLPGRSRAVRSAPAAPPEGE